MLISNARQILLQRSCWLGCRGFCLNGKVPVSTRLVFCLQLCPGASARYDWQKNAEIKLEFSMSSGVKQSLQKAGLAKLYVKL